MTDRELDTLGDSLLAQDRAARQKTLPPLGTLPPLVLSPADIRMMSDEDLAKIEKLNK